MSLVSYTSFNIKASIAFFLLLSIATIRASTIKENTRDVCQLLIEESFLLMNSKEYASAFEKLKKAEAIALENQWENKLWDIKNRIGVILLYTSNYGEALDYLHDSYNITKEHEKLHKHSVAPLSNIGLLYLKEKKYTEATDFFKQAYNLAKKEDLTERTITIAINLITIYNELGETEKSFDVFSDIQNHTSEVNSNFKLLTTYAETLFKKGQVTKAKTMAEQLFVKLEAGEYEDYREECYTCIAELLSNIYERTEDFELAIHYAVKGLNTTDDLSERIELYNNISNLYSQKGEYIVAIQYKDSVLQSSNSLSTLINRNLYEVNKVKFKLDEYQNELIKKKSQQKFYIMIFLLILIVFFSIYNGLKNKVIKQKQKTKIKDIELQAMQLKQKQLKHEVSEKNRELTAKALYQSSRNQLINDIVNTLEKSNTPNKEFSSQIRTIKNILQKDISSDDFMQHFESVNPLFVKKIKKKHAKLTSNDIRFLCYIFMNLSLKEIASIFNISYNACKKRKKRIMDKMGLHKEETSLYDYVVIMAK